MKIRNFFALVLGVILLFSLAGCGAESALSGSAVPEFTTPADTMNRYDGITDKESPAEDAGSNLPENRKLIQTVHMDVETEDLDAVLAKLEGRIAELNGYVQSSNVQNGSAYSGKRYRYAYMTLRIPAKALDTFVDQVGQVSNIVSSRKTVEDVTLSYVETEGRMKALQVEEARLLELLAEAKSLEDILKIEDRLTKVRTELEQVTSALRVYDNQVDYATIHLNITEVTEYTETTEPETVWERIAKGFGESWENIGNFFQELFVVLVVGSPYLILLGGSALIVVAIILLSIRKKRKKSESNEK